MTSNEKKASTLSSKQRNVNQGGDTVSAPGRHIKGARASGVDSLFAEHLLWQQGAQLRYLAVDVVTAFSFNYNQKVKRFRKV